MPAEPAPATPRKSYEHGKKLPLPRGHLDYVVKAGWLALRSGSDEKERAEVFFTYYRVDGARRPLTFVFNGGPGAASAFLHLGAIGPRRVAIADDGTTPAPPASLTDNHESWLPFTDLVFVDPVGTGLSRTIGSSDETDAKKKSDEPDTHYWNVDADLDSLATFFEVFLSAESRWGAPIYIAGESYGGYRAARLIRRAPQSSGVGISGAFLISPALEWDFLVGGTYDVLYHALLVPTMAAAAHAHGVAGTGASAADHRKAAERFALSDLLAAQASCTFQGGALESAVAERLSSFIGLSPALCRRRGGRIDLATFARELLRERGQVIGLYDAAMTTEDPLPNEAAFAGIDPTLGGINHLYTTAANAHLRNDLGVDDPRRYHLINMTVNEKWSFEDRSHEFHLLPAGAMKDLAIGMSSSPDTKVAITHGYYDLVTPYFVSDYLVGLLAGQSPAARRVRLQHFDGGHMFYARAASRAALRDLAADMIAKDP